MSFRITAKKGFHVTFDNGWTVSVQFGPGNYCEHYNRDILADNEACGRVGSRDAEIAVWRHDDVMLPFPNGDTVEGRAVAARVLEVMQWASKGEWPYYGEKESA